ncbi:MAG: hypothetical protein ACJ75K_20400 [Actinomycetes bacterium]|jgi:hypothetical protein
MAPILSGQQRASLEANHGAVMATVDDRGRPHAVPVLWLTVSGPVETRRERRVKDNLRLYRVAMVAERRLVYVLAPSRVYPSAR